MEKEIYVLIVEDRALAKEMFMNPAVSFGILIEENRRQQVTDALEAIQTPTPPQEEKCEGCEEAKQIPSNVPYCPMHSHTCTPPNKQPEAWESELKDYVWYNELSEPLKLSLRATFKSLLASQRALDVRRFLELVDKHDPNVAMGRETNKVYWGNTLREAIKAQLTDSE